MTARIGYDRGTLVIDGLASIAGLRGVDLTWDPRVGVWRTPARNHAALLRAFGRARVDHVDAARAVSAPVIEDGGQVDLLPYQNAALRAWELAGRRGVVVLPTRAGRIRAAITAILRTRLAALCLVPDRVQLEQWRAAIRRCHGGPVGRLGDDVRELAPITVASYQGAYRHAAAIGSRFDLLVVDEVHCFGRSHRDAILDMSLAGARLGLTATPLADPAAAAMIEALVGPEVYRLGTRTAGDGLLGELDLVSLPVELDDAEQRAHREGLARFDTVHGRFRQLAPGAGWRDFVRAAARNPAGRGALSALREARRILAYPAAARAQLRTLLAAHPGGGVLVVTPDDHTTRAIACEHLVAPLRRDVAADQRAAVLAMFRAGAVPTLVSAHLPDDGDLPATATAIVLGPRDAARDLRPLARLLHPPPGQRATLYQLLTRVPADATSLPHPAPLAPAGAALR